MRRVSTCMVRCGVSSTSDVRCVLYSSESTRPVSCLSPRARLRAPRSALASSSTPPPAPGAACSSASASRAAAAATSRGRAHASQHRCGAAGWERPSPKWRSRLRLRQWTSGILCYFHPHACVMQVKGPPAFSRWHSNAACSGPEGQASRGRGLGSSRLRNVVRSSHVCK